MLIRERVLASSTSGGVVARTTVRLSMQAGRRRKTKLLLLVVGRVAALRTTAVGILVRATDTRVPCVVVEATASAAGGRGRVAAGCVGFLVGAAGGARVA